MTFLKSPLFSEPATFCSLMEEKKKESSSSEDDSGASIQPISYRYLAAPHIMQQIYADMVNHYYWTEDWRPETYIR